MEGGAHQEERRREVAEHGRRTVEEPGRADQAGGDQPCRRRAPRRRTPRCSRRRSASWRRPEGSGAERRTFATPPPRPRRCRRTASRRRAPRTRGAASVGSPPTTPGAGPAAGCASRSCATSRRSRRTGPRTDRARRPLRRLPPSRTRCTSRPSRRAWACRTSTNARPNSTAKRRPDAPAARAYPSARGSGPLGAPETPETSAGRSVGTPMATSAAAVPSIRHCESGAALAGPFEGAMQIKDPQTAPVKKSSRAPPQFGWMAPATTAVGGARDCRSRSRQATGTAAVSFQVTAVGSASVSYSSITRSANAALPISPANSGVVRERSASAFDAKW